MAKDINSIFFDITPEIEELALKCETNNAIDKELYTKYEVKRGLRDLNGKGVLAVYPYRVQVIFITEVTILKIL